MSFDEEQRGEHDECNHEIKRLERENAELVKDKAALLEDSKNSASENGTQAAEIVRLEEENAQHRNVEGAAWAWIDDEPESGSLRRIGLRQTLRSLIRIRKQYEPAVCTATTLQEDRNQRSDESPDEASDGSQADKPNG